MLPQTGTKLTEKRGSKFGAVVAPSDDTEKNWNIYALQSILYTTAQKRFWKIYFLYDFWCAQTCTFPAVFGPRCEIWHLLSALCTDIRKNFLYRCTATVPALNYSSRIFFKTLSYLYEVVRTNFSADFWTFRSSWPQFRENCGAT